ncbi:hypothetical protein B0H67DRAFT_167439 [Lasiosphaeris hirsuta]|uniref:TeaA receptor TeaR n=1 Tax=Lasiosphaeris hirsuta TaxID=260670 RepID=A0AA40E003_9PEZI|nr:hypothetical protein B0H67DRAFT_167439 [Lasiosphaeris hirsuta]
MAAVSQTTTTLTPPSSSHGPGYPWDMAISGHTEKALRDSKGMVNDENTYPSSRPSLSSQHGHSAMFGPTTSIDPVSRKHSTGDMNARNSESSYLSPALHRDLKSRSINENGSPADSLLDLYDGARDERAKNPHKRVIGETPAEPGVDDNSKWIHRDKLARIESEELQAAGFYLPRPKERARSKSQNRARRDQSQDKINGQGRSIGGEQSATRSRKNSTAPGTDPRTPELESPPGWDLRLPEEIAEEGDDAYWVSNGNAKVSKIPVAKLSPVPIPSEHLERDTLLLRKRDGSPGDDDTIHYPKPRARSGSTGNALAKTSPNGTVSQPSPQSNKQPNTSPKKTVAAGGARKPSAVRPANGAAGRPKTRGGPSKDSTSSGGGTTRPSTRSGERELSIGSSKQMEGEPPWMVSAYRPDPRLPPDQQLLPTVARRLQQEKWEREGKFGNVYDREFRPLTDEGFLKPPEPEPEAAAEEEEDEKEYVEGDDRDDRDNHADWPLKAEARNSVRSAYSVMPRISDKPNPSPLPSPRTPVQPRQPSPVVRVPVPPEEPSQKKSGCGCCIVM